MEKNRKDKYDFYHIFGWLLFFVFSCLLLLWSISTQAFALTGTTKEWGIACTSEQYADDAISFLANKDVQNLQAYIDTGKCTFLKNGIKVNIVKYPMFGNAVFVFNGVKFYCPKSSLTVDTED